MTHPIDPMSAEYLAEPYPLLAQQLREEPVTYSAELDMWIITRFEDVEHVFLNQKIFSAANVQMPVRPLCEEALNILSKDFHILPVLSNADQPEHTRFRRRLAKAFSTKRMRMLIPIIEERCISLLDGFAQDGHADLAKELCYPLPALTIFAMIGFPQKDADMIKEWCVGKLELNWGYPTEEVQIRGAKTMVAFWNYCTNFVKLRRDEPGDDLTTDLMQNDGGSEPLSNQEIASIIFALSFAGHETTTNQTANCIRTIVEQDLWQNLRGNRDLIPAIVEECFRYDSSVIGWRRITTEATSVGGVDIPSGAKLFLSLGAANRDPSVFGDPDSFEPGRDRVKEHLSFGKGIHLCLGRELARIEIASVLNLMLDRFAELELNSSEPLTFPRNITFRGPIALEARWTLA